MRRRDLVFGAGCAAAAGAALLLKPHRELRLLPEGEKLEELTPMKVGRWIGQDINDPLALNGGEGTLAARLYNQMVVRLFTDPETSRRIVMLLAYGARQSDDLQLHRPEVCYPAFGYSLVSNESVQLRIREGITVPARSLVAEREDEREHVTYWARLGEYLPQDGSQQREARFRNAFQGLIPDGLLCRFSMGGVDARTARADMTDLVASLILSIRPDRRKVLVGSERAKGLAVTPGVSAPPT